MPLATYDALARAETAAIWNRLSDIESWPGWLRVPYASESVRLLTAGQAGAGAEFALKGRLPARLFARLTAWEERRRLAFEIYRSEYPSDRLFFGKAVITISLDPDGAGGTRVSCSHLLEGKGVLGRIYAATLMRPLIGSNARRIVESIVAADEPDGEA